MSIIVLTTNW